MHELPHVGRLAVVMAVLAAGTCSAAEDFRPPDIVRLGNALGITTLSVKEFLDCLE